MDYRSTFAKERACQLSCVEGGQDECVKVWKKLEAKVEMTNGEKYGAKDISSKSMESLLQFLV